MEDKHDKESNEEYAFLKEQPITDYDLDTLFFEHDKTKVSEKARKEFIKENSRVKADIRKGLTGDDEVAATNWKGFPTPRKRAIDKKGELIPRTSPVYKTLDLEDEANMITNRLTVPKNTPMTPRFQMDEKEWKDGAWRLLPTDSLRDLQYMATGGPAVMGIPVQGKINPAKKSGGRRKKRKKKTRKQRKKKTRKKKTRKKKTRKKRGGVPVPQRFKIGAKWQPRYEQPNRKTTFEILPWNTEDVISIIGSYGRAMEVFSISSIGSTEADPLKKLEDAIKEFMNNHGLLLKVHEINTNTNPNQIVQSKKMVWTRWDLDSKATYQGHSEH